jgi:hypothetical protein
MFGVIIYMLYIYITIKTNTYMETLKINFEKSFNGYSTKIELTQGINPKGVAFRNINQINTANDAVDSVRDQYEGFEISTQEMVEIIKSQGYQVV